VRAAQTAEHLARVFGLTSAVRELDALHPEGTAADASMALRGLSMHEHVMLVGHEPHLSTWLASLVSPDEGLRVLFKKAGAACVEVDRVPPPRGAGTLRWLMTPKQLTLIANHDARHH
jgi:phosphohistidine phosphatase